MAIYNAPYDPRGEKFGIMGNVLGQTLGALGGYAMHEYQKPEKIKRFKSFGATDEQANALANSPESTQTAWLRESMKMQNTQQKNAMIGNILGGGGQTQQPDLMSLPGGNISERLGGLGAPQQEQSQGRTLTPEQENNIIQASEGMSPQQIDEILKSGILNLNEINQVQGILDRKKAQQFKERAHEENKEIKAREQELKQEAPQRAQMVKEVAEIEKAGRSAKNLIAGFKNLKVASRDPELRTGLWKQALDRFGFGEMGQSPISFGGDKMIQDINFASASSVTTPGKMTASLLENVARANPSVFTEPEGIEAMADLKIYGSKIQEEVQKQIDKIRESSPRGLLPIDTVSKAYKAAQPKIEKLHEKELKVVERLAKAPKPNIPKGGSLIRNKKTGALGIKMPNGEIKPYKQ